MREFNTIQSAVQTVHQQFGRQFGLMDFLFTHRHRSHRTVINVIRSLPGMLIRLTDEHSPDVAFEATWIDPTSRAKAQYRPDADIGWANAAQNIFSPQAYSKLSHIFTNVRRVREISIFDWGFEIRSADNVDLTAVSSLFLKDPSPAYLQSIVGEPFKGVKVIDTVKAEVLMSWRHKGDSFMDGVKKRLMKDDKDAPSVGQHARKLLLDDE